MKKLRKCSVCSKYTTREECCEKKTDFAHPPKFSPEDKYAKYRRELRYGKEKKKAS
ncbi:MAG: nucleolar RNA-binding Nop10p family protein [Candidatus Micrarchaeota archaeon]